MSEYINQLILFLEQFLENRKDISSNVIQYNCVLCGRSKNNTPHMRIDYENGFFYCYRCQKGGILYNLLKEFKNKYNKEYVNTILSIYFNIYKYDSNFSANGKKINFVKNFSYCIDNLITQNKLLLENCKSVDFIKYRLGNDINIEDIVNRFKLSCNDNVISYNSYYMKYNYGYKINELDNYKKFKQVNKNIVNNDKVDYYHYLQSYDNDSLYISESLFDLITIYISNRLNNSLKSNFLSLCGKNYKNVFTFLLNTGKFFYDNIYIVLDNDINKSEYVTNVINILSNNKNIYKYKLYNNIYLVSALKQYTDINNQYISRKYKLDEMIVNKL